MTAEIHAARSATSLQYSREASERDQSGERASAFARSLSSLKWKIRTRNRKLDGMALTPKMGRWTGRLGDLRPWFAVVLILALAEQLRGTRI